MSSPSTAASGALAQGRLPRDAGPRVVQGEHLDVGYDGRPVWRDASISVSRGEFVAIIGPNGAGKTTLFRMLLGLVRPMRGSLEVFGEEPHHGNRKIGYVPQRHPVDAETNVQAFELVRLGYSGHRWGLNLLHSEEEWDAAWEALEAVDAAALAKKPLGAMSGGELQRIFLAEAIVSKPELLLLDEPLASLDLRRSREIVRVVDRLVRTRNVTALLVSHDINPLIQHLDKVIYVANGKVAAGTPGQVLTTERLTALYGVPVEVLRDSRGNIVIVGGEDSHADPEGP